MSTEIDYVLKRFFNYTCNVPNVGLSEKEIEQSEKEFDTVFPDDYKKFLSYANGGDFFDIEEFFKVSPDSRSYIWSIREAMEIFSELLKDTKLPNPIPIHRGAFGLHLLSNGKLYRVNEETGDISFITCIDFFNQIIKEFKYLYIEIEPTITEEERELHRLAMKKKIQELKNKF